MSDRINRWLEEIGLGEHAESFVENDIDFDLLTRLSTEDLKELGLSVGHRRRFLDAVAKLQEAESEGTGISSPSPLHGEAERRQLTVMFCDLVGSTALSERLDPEELRDLLATYQETCSAVVSRFEGYIARYVGDGLLIYFGYPQAHEDDAQRAVRAGLGIVEAIQALDTKTTQPGVTLAVRIGITTGLVVAGDIGSGEQHEEKAIVGETPNLAARLQALAEPNAVVIGISTQRLVEDLFEFDDLGPQRVKGISEPVTAYRVRRESDAASGSEARVARRLTPLVGRDSEIDLLLNRWQQAEDGEGQAVLLAGEAGIGKSRIVRGFQERVQTSFATGCCITVRRITRTARSIRPLNS